MWGKDDADLCKLASAKFSISLAVMARHRIRVEDGELQVFFPKAGTWQNAQGKDCSPKPSVPSFEDSEQARHGDFAASRAALREKAQKT